MSNRTRPVDAKLPTFKHGGVAYRGHTPECQHEFQKSPDTFAKTAKEKRWENNFVAAMSLIWCPVTDEVNTGGRNRWKRLGLEWESCCKFCDEDFLEEDFDIALKILKKRAETSYKETK